MSRRAAVLVAVALAWVCVGVYGAFSYGDAYLTYRGFPPPKDPTGVAVGTLQRESFHSAALGTTRSYLVYTPPGYAAAAARGVRFPVMYLLHGSPGRPIQFINVARAGVDLDEGLAAHRLRPFILVMPGGGDGHFRNQTEWANTPHGQYESYVLEVVHNVDSRFATLRSRRFRAIAGDSEGGFAAVNIALHQLRTFSIAEAWSGYFTEHAKGAFAGFPQSVVRANSPSAYVPALGSTLRRLPLHAYIYKGSREPSLPLARRFALELRRNGGRVTFAAFPGRHDWRLWRGQMPHMLAYADGLFGARP